MSDFRLQIVHADDGRIATWRPGIHIETDLIEDLCIRLQKRGVGWFTSEAKVLTAVREELAGLIFELKAKVR